jgi:hypothetical protein
VFFGKSFVKEKGLPRRFCGAGRMILLTQVPGMDAGDLIGRAVAGDGQ